MANFNEVGIAIEAVAESVELKLKLFRELDAATPPGAILASNTSSISITLIAAATGRPDRVIGMHFFNPVPVMKLVELIRGLQTSDATFAAVKALAEKWDKTTTTAKDYPGFIVNRLLIPFLNEACDALMSGVGGVEDIDTSIKLGLNHPMGPFRLADLIGLDTVLAIARVLHDGLGEAKYRPSPLLVKYVEAGWLGRKTGRGFHSVRRSRRGDARRPPGGDGAMITQSPLEDLVTCLIVWAVLVWALWLALEELDEWVAEGHDGEADRHDFPDEQGGEARAGVFHTNPGGLRGEAPPGRVRLARAERDQ